MSKNPHRTDPEVAHGNRKVDSTPYNVAARRERSRELAQKRRTSYKSIMEELTQALPFPKDVVSQLDYNSRLRLSLCFFRLKTLLANGHIEPNLKSGVALGGAESEVDKEATKSTAVEQHKLLQPGMLQSMMAEALDGFLLVASSEGTIVYLSKSVHHYLGIFQSEHIGVNIYDIISEEDHETVRKAIATAETNAISHGLKKNKGSQVEFFCRMKCSRFRVANTITKSPGFKVVYISGSIKVMRGSHFLVTVVRPVSPPSILEIRMEANMFVSHYSMDLKCVFFDGRLKHLLGYQKSDLEGVMPEYFKHSGDIEATQKCSTRIVEMGECLSGYYRFMTRFGFYVWIQTRGSLMYDSRTGKPTHLVALNYIITKEKGEKDLELREAITTNTTGLADSFTHSYDPFPVSSMVNPFPEVDDTGNRSRQEDELEGDVTVVKEEFPLPKSETDSGVHSKCHSLRSGSRYSSSSTVSSNSPRSGPSSSSDYYSNLSPACLPDSSSDLLTSVHPSVESSSPAKSSFSMAEYEGQAPLGEAPLGGRVYPPLELTQYPQSLRGALKFDSRPGVPTSSLQHNSGANMLIKHEQDKGNFHGDVTNGGAQIYQQQRCGMADEYQASYDTDTVAIAEKGALYNTDTMTTAEMTPLHPQASWYNMDAMVTSRMMNPQSYGTVTMEMAQMTHPQLPVTQFEQPSTNHSEVHNLLTLQNPVLPHNATLPNVPPNTEVWSEAIPLLTDEDFDLLDFIAN